MRAVSMPASCSSRNGWPASTDLNWSLSPTSASRAAPSLSATFWRLRIWTVPIMDASSTTITAPRNRSRASRSSGPSASPRSP